MRLLSAFFATAALVCAADANPLLEQSIPIPFDRIKAEHVEPAAAKLLEGAKAELESYVAADQLDYKRVLLDLDAIGDDLNRAMQAARHLDSVVSTPQLRAAIDKVLPLVTAFQTSLKLDPRIWAKVKRYAASDEAKSLSAERKRMLELTVKRFRRAGADLDDASRKKLAELNVELSRLSKKFSDNALESTNAFDYVVRDEAGLAGLPERLRAEALQSAKSKGSEGWRFTLHPPSLDPLLTYLDDSTVREKMYRASMMVAMSGEWDNRPVTQRILELRRERARMLGYEDWADLVTEERMAGSAAKVREFLAALEKKTRPAFQKELEERAAYRRTLEGPQALAIQSWDARYYTQKFRKARYDLDPEMVRPYFPFDSVLKGLFEVTGKLYGVGFVKASAAPVWHPTVEYFEARDADGAVLGYFYTDFFSRPNKRDGAWATNLISRWGGRSQVGAIVGNVTAPSGGKPALLSHAEVRIIFHEFGHLVAMLVNRVSEPSLRQFVWDFVEAPSQIMENFLWKRECLDLFARHYQSGERLPDSLFQRMLAARNFGAAQAQMTQLGLATLDLELHTNYDPASDGDPAAYGHPIQQRFAGTPLPAGSMLTKFLHIFAGGYSAGYYSYKWAEVLEADAFARFEKEGIFNPRLGLEFRRKILERGDSADAAVLFRDFMGRDPDSDALLRRSGLLN